MARGHKVMLVLDTAGGAARPVWVRRAALRLLAYLGGRFGLAGVHWAFKFFDSQGARGRPSRASDFRELGTRSWEDFEEELDTRLGDGVHGAHLPGPAPRASHTHGALMETLLDYQWDRPEITSPAKPVLRSRGRRLMDAESEAEETGAALGGFANAVFLVAPCPHSQRELLQFVAGCEAQAPRVPPSHGQVLEKLLPRRIREAMVARSITLYWVDTTEPAKLWDSPDHVGYWTVCELLRHGGGAVLPSEIFSQGFSRTGETELVHEGTLSSTPHLSPWISALPTDATLNQLLYNSPEYEASFPQIEGTLFLPVKGRETGEAWTVILEPLAMHQRHFQSPVSIFLEDSVAHWSLPVGGSLGTDCWVLQCPEEGRSAQRLAFQQLADTLMARGLHLVVTVDPGGGWSPITGVISPLSACTMVLTVFRTMEAEFQGHFLQTTVAEGSQDTDPLFSDVVDGILSQLPVSCEDPASCAPVPEWARQELGRSLPWSPAMVEKWFPFSNISGASSNLMESFWLLQDASAGKEESSGTESELTHGLSELYHSKSSEDSAIANLEDRKKKRGVPRTPVRQKMNTMCRSLKMLNVARLNVKAQKLNPDGSPDVAGEKGTQKTAKTAGGRMADRLEDRGRTLRSFKLKDFKTEEELLSYLHENYQKAVATRETSLYSCAQNMVSTIKVFLKSKGTKELEESCLNHVKSNLLATSKGLLQNLEKKLNKEDKVRECQLQVFLRLEMCLQCTSILECSEGMEQAVEEEVTDLLRLVCRVEDSAYLSKFLEEILQLYIDSIPETLGKLYDSLAFQIPQKLAAVLPSHFFSDDSMTQESKSPPVSEPPGPESGGAESDQLEELRTRSAKKRRKNTLIRHKSLADVSQNLRQIEVPKVSKQAPKTAGSQPAPPPPVKDTAGQEVTKVRRNLFNQEMLSPSKRSLKRGLPRSHSVSAVEGLAHQLHGVKKTRSAASQGYHRLLTKRVAETPVHKQTSRRLLHRQLKGRSSDPGPDVDVVEESPEKGEGETILRRSPRIKSLSFSRAHSSSFYSVSQPKSRSVQRVHSFQQDVSDKRETSLVQCIQSPKRFLFGALREVMSPTEKGAAQVQKHSRSTLDSEVPAAYQTPKKNCQQSPTFSKTPLKKCPRSPQTPSRPSARLQNCRARRTPTKLSTTQGSDSPGMSEAPQEGPSRAAGISPLGTKTPRTPCRPVAPPPPSVLDHEGLHLETPSPKDLAPSPTQPSSGGPISVGLTLRTPPRPELRPQDPARNLTVSPKPQLPSPKSAVRRAPSQTPPAEPAWADLLQCPSTPPRGSPLPSNAGRWGRRTSDPQSGHAQGSTAPGLSPAARTGSVEGGSPSPPCPESPNHPDSCVGSGSPMCPPVLPPRDTEYLTLLEEGEGCGWSPGEELRAPMCDPGVSVPSWGPSTPELMPSALGHSEDLRQRQLAAARTYDVELEVQAGGPPKLRIRKRQPGAEEDPPREEGSPQGEGPPRDGRCPLPAHSTPGKAGAQTFICRACTPSRGAPGVRTPPTADAGVPWTPSPKQSGKTTPDAIRAWPRRKRAVDCGAGPGPERPEDGELDGVSRLPDLTPPRAGAEDAWGSGKWPLPAVEDAPSPGWAVPADGDEVSVSGATPPGWSGLSASGLQALTRSPLLFQARTPGSQGRDPRGVVDAHPSTPDESPFSGSLSQRRPFSRTYTRKKLIS
ncbi:treslin [Perognathus longimembris pacificus]|uniref:treslin n=1 Tax=Perognathus longimembris pacificus TaxID=214514 RepID=UPI002019A603|nr:treslin [Perognathus longimembris pacificus]